jgi:hypothetical protein
MSSRVAQQHLDTEHVWYLEYFDVQLEDWSGIAPYTEFYTELAACRAYLEHKKKVPGGNARVVRETRERYVVTGPVNPKRPLSRRNQNDR